MYAAVILQLLLITVTSSAPVDVTYSTTKSANTSISTQSSANISSNNDNDESVPASICKRLISSSQATFHRMLRTSHTNCTCISDSRAVCQQAQLFSEDLPGPLSVIYNLPGEDGKKREDDGALGLLDANIQWICVILDSLLFISCDYSEIDGVPDGCDCSYDLSGLAGLGK